ncbi:TniB family NTP-binding protein [Leisingera aquimarina]|uniref:TniB family NTP-binding protein n=1 Tax=Leisingera aquimarina TaxID=476529 RepID=UPI0004833E60|nr:TniB family NTP-binding protein [Leisingera aquimarina]
MSPEIDPKILDVRIQHKRHNEVLAELQSLTAVAKSFGGAIIPLLGPTRCGKTEVLWDSKVQLNSIRRGPGSLVETNSFAVGSIPPKPNDRDIYLAMLRALGYKCATAEKIPGMRDRLIAAIQADGVEVLALDECSHCVETGANLTPRTAVDHFKTLVDATGIVLVLCWLTQVPETDHGQ